MVWSAQYSGSPSIFASPRARVAASTPRRSQKSCQKVLISSALMSSARRPCFLAISSPPIVVIVLQRLHARWRFFLAPQPSVQEQADQPGHCYAGEDDEPVISHLSNDSRSARRGAAAEPRAAPSSSGSTWWPTASRKSCANAAA